MRPVEASGPSPKRRTFSPKSHSSDFPTVSDPVDLLIFLSE